MDKPTFLISPYKMEQLSRLPILLIWAPKPSQKGGGGGIFKPMGTIFFPYYLNPNEKGGINDNGEMHQRKCYLSYSFFKSEGQICHGNILYLSMSEEKATIVRKFSSPVAQVSSFILCFFYVFNIQ